MKLMKFGKDGSHLGKIFKLNFVEEVLRMTPFSNEWQHVDGRIVTDKLCVTAILADGNRVKLKQRTRIMYIDTDIKDQILEVEDIGMQIAELNAQALILETIFDNQDNHSEVRELLILTQLDWNKIRRRVEDALRKSFDKEILFEFAQKLNCKLF
jgi:hypothetical protein